MKIDCIADLHGNLPILEGGDLLIIAGDICARDKVPEWFRFFEWLKEQNYRKKLLVAGNHDNVLAQSISTLESKAMGLYEETIEGYEYLCDSGTKFEGLKIWGTPWTPLFPRVHPKCKAFMGTEYFLEKKFALIPDDTDILISHGPPFGMMDLVPDSDCPCHETYNCKKPVGSKSLFERINNLKLKLLVFGHVHEGYGRGVLKRPGFGTENNTQCINCSYVNERYEPVNKPIRIEI